MGTTQKQEVGDSLQVGLLLDSFDGGFDLDMAYFVVGIVDFGRGTVDFVAGIVDFVEGMAADLGDILNIQGLNHFK